MTTVEKVGQAKAKVGQANMSKERSMTKAREAQRKARGQPAVPGLLWPLRERKRHAK